MRENGLIPNDVHYALRIVGEHVQRHLSPLPSAASSIRSASHPSASSTFQTDARPSLTRVRMHPGFLPGAPAQHQQLLVLPPLDRRCGPSCTEPSARSCGTRWSVVVQTNPFSSFVKWWVSFSPADKCRCPPRRRSENPACRSDLPTSASDAGVWQRDRDASLIACEISSP